MRKLILILLAFTLLLPVLTLSSCDEKTPATDTDTTESTTAEKETEKETEEETEESMKKEIVTKTYKLAESLSNFKIHGRSSVVSEGLACDFSASGIEFNAYIEGTLTLNVTVSKGTADARTDDCYFTVYIDGERQGQRLKATKSTSTKLTLATFETGGVHNIRVVKQTEPRNALAVLTDVSFTGYFEEAPTASKYLIEFLGDSLTAGYGNLTSGGTAAVAQTSVNQDGTQAYAYLTAEKLGADCSIIAASGIGLVRGYRSFPMSQLFEKASYYRNDTTLFTPARTPDLVVINLGGNDKSKGVSSSELESGMISLINRVRLAYGESIPIILIDKENYATAIEAVVQNSGGNLYKCTLVVNKDGGNNHPSLEAHKINAELLAKFIQDNNILK